MLRRIIAINLAKRGHSVVEAETVAHSVQLLVAAVVPFDLVLLDIMLPDGSGWELLRRAREQPAHAFVPVIVMTAVVPEPSSFAPHAPAAIMLKPFGIDALLRLIERVLGATMPPSEPSQ